MSEYQYYEFLAIDRPLTKEQMAELRTLSTRATITSTRLQNEYHWGDFKGNPSKLMEKYFDAFVYFANWGTREFMLRLPKRLLGPETTSLYCACDGADARFSGDFTILEFHSEDEESSWEDEDDGWMESLVPLRSELASGDLRCLYLGWLMCAQDGFLDDDTVEPPVPPGLAKPSASLKAFADFLRVDENLIAEAAVRSPVLRTTMPSRFALESWIQDLPASEKDALLLRLMEEGVPTLQAELLQRFRKSQAPSEGPAFGPGGRTVAELISAAEERAERHRREEERRKAEEQARLERERAAARTKYLDSLVGREDRLWHDVEALIQAKKAREYDQAVELLKDIRDLAARAGSSEAFDERLSQLRQRHSNKPSFMERLARAKLG